MKLTKVKTVEIVPSFPFDFDSTFHKPDHFTSGDNEWQPGIRWQTWRHNDKCLGLKFVNQGVVDKPKIKVEIYSDSEINKEDTAALIDEIKYRYNLNLDLTDFYNQFKDEKTLGPIIKKWRGMRPGHPSSLYEYLIIGVVLQNATVARSVQMFTALLENYGTLLEFDKKNLPRRKAGLWCFWEEGGLQEATEEDLRALKVGYRAKRIKKIDDHFFNGKINEFDLRQKDLETQKEILLDIYGVGPATVWYLLFDVFHHWDHFDHVSPWEQKIYSKLFFDQDPDDPVPVEKILKHFEKYGDYKQLAVHYIWEDLWWRRKNKDIAWLEKLIRI